MTYRSTESCLFTFDRHLRMAARIEGMSGIGTFRRAAHK
jgi:ABC-type Fe3+ transport system permease subunit